MQDEDSALATEPAENMQNTIIGQTLSKPLKPSLKTPKVIAPEELEDVFLNNEFEEEYLSETKDVKELELPKEEQTEVLNTQGTNNSDVDDKENEQIQKNICMDYDQMLNSTRKLIRNEALDIADAETLDKLEGTDIATQLEKVMPNYLYRVREALAKTSYH